MRIIWKIKQVIRLGFTLIFIALAFLSFTIGPIVVSIIFQNPLYLFTYLISWYPSFLFIVIAQIIIGD